MSLLPWGATMRRIATAAALSLIQLAASGQAAARDYPATPSGLSVGAGLDLFYDGTVTGASGQSLHGHGGELTLDVLGNLGDFAAGGVLAASPGILGDGRLL